MSEDIPMKDRPLLERGYNIADNLWRDRYSNAAVVVREICEQLQRAWDDLDEHRMFVNENYIPIDTTGITLTMDEGAQT